MALPATLPHRTVRDLLAEIGPPSGKGRHEEKGSARVYKGHLPSMFDQPSKTIRAGAHGHGPVGGSNTVLLDTRDVRYFTVLEMARLQGFPKDYIFDPVWRHAIKEIGNACPPPLAVIWIEALCARSNLIRILQAQASIVSRQVNESLIESSKSPDELKSISAELRSAIGEVYTGLHNIDKHASMAALNV